MDFKDVRGGRWFDKTPGFPNWDCADFFRISMKDLGTSVIFCLQDFTNASRMV